MRFRDIAGMGVLHAASYVWRRLNTRIFAGVNPDSEANRRSIIPGRVPVLKRDRIIAVEGRELLS